MLKILRFKKMLDVRPEEASGSEFNIRIAEGPEDAALWSALRQGAFIALIPGGRPWTHEDFDREFAEKRLWLAVKTHREEQVVGAVALGRALRPPRDRASLEWLMVDPAFRRRGIGRALVTIVEQAAWDAGDREIVLETHADWRDAVRLYERCGYVAIK